VRLRNLVGVVRGRARIILIVAIVTCAVALGVSYITPAAYQARATIMLTQQNVGTALLGAPQAYRTDMALQRDVQTQVNVMRSPVVLERVIAKLKLPTNPTDLAKKVTVKFDGETNIVTIEATDGSSQQAADVANAIAVAYVAWSQEQQRTSIRAAVNDVEKRLTAAQKQIADAQTAIATGDRSGTRQAQLQAADSLYASLSDKLAQLQINEQLSTGAGSILDNATPSSNPSSPKPLRNGAL
jgi:uncharacterized protein involved in exopolysaccharide biosynthesis